MKKFVTYLLLAMSVVIMLLISGCGSSDKFSGIWYSMAGDGSMRVFNIEKNGKDYVVTETWYDYKVNVKDQNPDAFKADYIYNLTLEEKIPYFAPKKQAATAKDNQLILAGSMGTEFFNYNEKDGTLTYKKLTLKKADVKTERDLVKANLDTIHKKQEKYLQDKTESTNKDNWIHETILEINFNDSVLDK